MPNFYNLLRARKFSSAADTAVEIAAYDSATPNFIIDAGGKLSWSSGSANADTNLYRSAANKLKTDNTFDLASGKTYQIDGSDVLSSTTLGSGVINSSLTSVGSLSGLTVSGTVTLQQSLEKVTISGNTTTTTPIDLLTSAVHMYSGVGPFSFDFRGNSTTELNAIMSVGQSITSVIMVTNTTAYTLTAVYIDNTVQTIKWFGGSAPSGNANSTDIYTFTIIKTGSNTYTVFGSQSKFA